MRVALLAAACGPFLCTACSSGEVEAALVAPPSRDGFEPTGPFPGFTLVSPLQSHQVVLVDMAGEAVHAWPSEFKTGEAVYLTERGTLLKCQRAVDHPIFQDAGGHGGRIQELDWNGDVLWDFRWDSEKGLNHHDVEELPNGNVLFIAWDRTTREWALEHGRDPELLEGEEFWAGAVYEVKPTRPVGGEIVWSWHATDHLIQDHDATLANHGKPWEHPEKIDINGDRNPEPPDEEEQRKIDEEIAALGYGGGADTATAADEEPEEEEDPVAAARKKRVKDADWMHTNGIDYNAELDQIAISVRRFDEVWILDHSITREEARGPKGDLLYRWGNPYSYRMGRFEERRLFGQHNVQWIPEGYLGAGNLLVFNNGGRDREHSSVDEWWAPRDANGRYPREEDQPWGPGEIVWTYARPEAEEGEEFYSRFISGAQRLPNGNTLICSGAQWHVFEVTPAGEVVWDFKSPFGATDEELDEDMHRFRNAMFRAERYAPDHPGIVALRARGAPVPEDPGTGPATNQWVKPEGWDEEDSSR